MAQMVHDDAEVLDLVYDAALEPGLWARALERVADSLGGAGAMLVWQNQADRSGQGLGARLDPRVPELYFNRFNTRHPTQRWVNNPQARVRHFIPHIVTDDDAMPKAQLMRTEFYNEFMRPFDMHSIVRVGLGAQALDAAFLAISRPERKGRFEHDDLARAARLHPHLIRAFKMDRALEAVRQAKGEMARLLDLTPYALFVVDADGRVRHANAGAERLLADRAGLTTVSGRLSCGQAEATGRLRGLIAAATAPQAGDRSGGSMAILTPMRLRPLSVVVAPAGGDRFHPFHNDRCALVCVTDLDAAPGLEKGRLRDLFGLTGAEAEVALALFDGETPQEAALTLGVSVNTIRTHLARIFEKTGAHRQAELIRLMMRATDLGSH